MTNTHKSLRVSEAAYTNLVKYKSQISSITGKPVSFDEAITDALEIATSKTYYCAVQYVGATIVIFGIGRTSAETTRDAMQAADNIDGLNVYECTSDVYSYVLEHGGAGKFEKAAGTNIIGLKHE